jgi:NADPH-ferrihemoprotein reductase
MWASLKNTMDLHEQEQRFEPAFTVIEKSASEDAVFLGERSEDELKGITSAEPGPQNPFVARILASKELCASPDRHCLHMELDIRNSGLSYETGDHVAIWPSNSDVEVERFLRVFRLLEKRYQTVQISVLDANKQLPFPTPTTYDAAVRYYMEICGPVSRQFLGTLATFMPDKHQKATVVKLSKDKDYFREKVSKNLFNLAQLVESFSPEGSISSIPFKVLIEGLRALQPR